MRGWRPWTVQPPPGTPIDWDSPLAQGLKAVYAPGLINALSGRALTNSGVTVGASSVGLALSGFTTTAYLTDDALPYLPPPFSAVALVTSTAPIGGPAAQAIFSFGGAAAGYGWKFGGGNGTYGITSDELCLTYGDIADYGFSGSYFSQLGVPVAVGLSVGPSSASAYRNGENWGTVTVGTPTTPTQPARLGVDYNGTAGTVDDPWSGQIAFVGLWGLELAASAHDLIAPNPWQLFHKRRRAYSIPTSSGAAGTAAITEASDTVSATGNIAIPGTASITEASDTVAATGALAIAGTASITEASDTVAATGALAVAGTAAITEQPDVVAATGGIALSGAAAIFEAGDIVVATGALGLAGTAAITEAPDSVAATGGLPPQVTQGAAQWTIARSATRNFSVRRSVPRSFTLSRSYTRNFTVNPMAVRFPVKGTSEKVPLTFDFTQDLPSGVTLTGTPTIGVSVSNGTDSNPTGILNGAAGFNSGSTQVIQPVQGGVNGADYSITCTCPTTQSNLTLSLVGLLSVRRDLN